jgi:large subunit ribosomal protein L32
MALPKRRHSRERGRRRRTHDSLSTPGVTKCPHCNTIKLPHRVCANCGYYGGREIVSKKSKESS